jgi:transcriptional regulator with XRE-family HTH domain
MRNVCGERLRTTRVTARISGAVLCKRAGIGRTRLSEIERGHVVPSPETLERIETALADLIRTKRKLAALAVQEGWPGPEWSDAEVM